MTDRFGWGSAWRRDTGAGRRWRIAALALCMAVAAFAAHADTVGFKNGDRISGKLVGFQNGTLQYRTAYQGTLSIPHADIAYVTTDDFVTVLFDNGVRASGRIVADHTGAMRLVRDATSPRPLIDLATIAAINPGLDHVPSVFRWSGRIDLALKSESGNSDTDELNIEGRIRGRSKDQRLTANGEISFEKSNDVTVSEDANATFTHEKFVSEKLFFFTRMFLEYDRFKDLDLRVLLSTGPGYQFYESEDLNFLVSGGLGWLHEDYDGDADDRDDPALSWSYEYDQFFFDRFVQFFHNHAGTLNLNQTDEATLYFRWGLRFPMRWGFVASTRFDLDHETEPAPGTRKTDKTFRLGLGYEW